MDLREKRNHYNVYFSDGASKNRLNQERYILIVPIKEKKNDNYFNIRFQYNVIIEHRERFSGEIFIAFQGDKGILFTENKISNLLRNGTLLNFYEKIKEHNMEIKICFSMLPNMESYRKIIKEIGIEDANNVLKSLSDIVWMNLNKPRVGINLKELIKSDIFNFYFLKNNESYFTFYNAHSLLSGLEFEEFGNISKDLTLQFKLNQFRNEHVINFNFDPSNIIPSRINILIGKNGIGKSTSLKNIVKVLLGKKDCNAKFFERSRDGGRPLINRLIAIGTPGETDNTFPSDKLKFPKINYRRLSLSRRSIGLMKGIGETVVRLIRLNESLGGRDRLSIFIDAIKSSLPVENIVLPLKKNSSSSISKDYFYLVDLANINYENEIVKICGAIDLYADPKICSGDTLYTLSSGQLSFFKVALLACMYIENGSLVLLDEPETHLHPNLITDFVEILDGILKTTGSLAIIATHSVYFAREVSRKQVHVFLEDANKINVTNPRFKTFGADIGDISHFVFEDKMETKLAERIIMNKGSSITKNEIETLKTELSSEVIMMLKRDIF